ncbi:DinB family protein [Chitinophaga nivalis]|uniref:Damage-inducible protein DinB n=1 Tax=Chitinophaga nivalis TaxID=2991709 RepID=A0ABT3IK70_9BACT|nr:DinB family protein [Chitinophaga nivalis]MCW3465960.1 hypothetical protein [Chitinophaga nivalis]MCW3484349.1 hypothetical protein [Chitinophaga nivalis]
MKPIFKELFDYNNHCNQKLEEVFLEHTDKVAGKIIKLYSHILNAHQIWNHRMASRDLVFSVWDMHTVQDVPAINKVNYEQTQLLLDKIDLHNTIQYKMKDGRVFSKQTWEILFHVINHSTYHRAQIATACKENGLTPVATDYILYERK